MGMIGGGKGGFIGAIHRIGAEMDNMIELVCGALSSNEENAKISGIIITKLDGISNGGFIISIAQKFQKPIYALGIGEKTDDLDKFIARDFAESIIGLE